MKSSGGIIRLIVFCVLGVTLAAVTGRLSVHTVNDTPSYLNYPLGSLSDAMLSIRTPGYPIFLKLVTTAFGISMVPLLQVLIHAVASWSLGEELLHRGMPIRPALINTFCVMVGCTAADHVSTVSTDAPAASLGVLVATSLMRAYRTRSRTDAILCSILATLTIFVRPAYLFLIPWIAFAGWLLARQQESKATAHSESTSLRLLGLKISCGVAVVVLGWMLFRQRVVSDFGIAPFGHQNLSAILVQTVPPKSLRDLPGQPGELGRRVADEMQKQAFQLPTVANQPIPTLTLESQWGQINYGVIWPIAKALDRQQGEPDALAPEIRVHRRIGAMNRAILSREPGGYFRWLLLAIRRAVWGTVANIAMHPIFLVMILAGMTGLVSRACRAGNIGPFAVPNEWAAFAIIGISYAIFSIGFIILSSPPIGRFADAGAIFLPGLVASFFVGTANDDRKNPGLGFLR
jgi:hypothetical protein